MPRRQPLAPLIPKILCVRYSKFCLEQCSSLQTRVLNLYNRRYFFHSRVQRNMIFKSWCRLGTFNEIVPSVRLKLKAVAFNSLPSSRTLSGTFPTNSVIFVAVSPLQATSIPVALKLAATLIGDSLENKI